MPPFSFYHSYLLILVSAWCTMADAQHFEVTAYGDHFVLIRDTMPVTDTVYTEMSEIAAGRLWVNKGELYGYIDTAGNEITPFIYDEVSSFRDGRARVARDSMYGFLDLKGEEVIAVAYSGATRFREGLASVLQDGKWYLIDTSGTTISPTGYDHPAHYLSRDFICVCRQGKWGVINANGELIHPFGFDLILPSGKAWIGEQEVILNLR